MEIHQKSDNRIIIELSKGDLADFRLNFAQIDYKSDETKQLINTLLYEAEKKLGKTFGLENKMLIDVLPKNDGGCIFLFTMSDIKKACKPELAENYSLLMAEPGSLNALFLLAEQLKLHRESIALCSLYTAKDSKYFLIVKPFYLDNAKITGIMSEYSNVKGVSQSKLNQLKEHCSLLSEDAITSLTL